MYLLVHQYYDLYDSTPLLLNGLTQAVTMRLLSLHVVGHITQHKYAISRPIIVGVHSIIMCQWYLTVMGTSVLIRPHSYVVLMYLRDSLIIGSMPVQRRQHWLNINLPVGPRFEFACSGILVNTIHWTNVGLMFVHRLRRWTNIKPTLVQCIMFAMTVSRC